MKIHTRQFKMLDKQRFELIELMTMDSCKFSLKNSISLPRFGCYHLAYIKFKNKRYCLNCSIGELQFTFWSRPHDRSFFPITAGFNIEHRHEKNNENDSQNVQANIHIRLAKEGGFCSKCNRTTLTCVSSLREWTTGCHLTGNTADIVSHL